MKTQIDPTKENKQKIAVSGIKKETIITSNKSSKFIKFLRNFASVRNLEYF
jgi:hypothetical protein